MKKKKKSRLNKVDVLFWLGAALLSLSAGLLWELSHSLVVSGLFCLAASFLAEPPVKEDDG